MWQNGRRFVIINSMEVKRLSENVPFIIPKSLGDMRFINKLLLRFVSKREAFCMETESVLYQNGGLFVWKRKVGIGFSPLFCSHPKHCHIQHVSLLGVDDTCLCRGDFFGNQMAFDGIRMNAVVNLIVFSTHSLTLITKLGKPACILKWSNSTTLRLGLFPCSEPLSLP